MRNRSGSLKRKPDDAMSYASVANGGFGAVTGNTGLLPEKIEELTVNISKVTSLCDKIDGSLDSADDGPVKTVLQDISNAIRLLNNNHDTIVKGQSSKAQPVISNRPC
jgi:hypothetical protein